MTLLRDFPDDFAVLVERTAATLAYPPAFVERDYWITEILRSIARPIDGYDASVVFKGGTSLSKGWRLLQRMSEDVDVLVVYGPSISRTGRDRVLKELVARVERDIGIESTVYTAEKGVHRARYFGYRQRYAHTALTGERVLLELGTRGGSEPHQRLILRSLMSDVAVRDFGSTPEEFVEFAPVVIDTLRPERTLFEKLAALHDLATPKAGADLLTQPRPLGTKLRHAYDIAMLLSDDATLAALRAMDRAAMVADIERRSVENGWGWTPRPPGGYVDSPAFQATFIEHPAVGEAYARVLDLVVGGPKPSLAEVTALARAQADAL
jgi:Nucleotidyl transferase AbiEii toxin, Type IV TA system